LFYLPAARRIYGSLISVFNEAPSIGSLDTPGFNTVNCNTINGKKEIKNHSKKKIGILHPSNKPNVAKTKNGDALPTYSYINPPNGGPTIINNQ